MLLGMDFSDFAMQVAQLINMNAHYEIDYVLRPGARHVEIRSRMVNRTDTALAVPSPLLKNLTFQAQVFLNAACNQTPACAELLCKPLIS